MSDHAKVSKPFNQHRNADYHMLTILNDIRVRPVGPEHVMHAIRTASSGPVPEGTVGAGTGTMCFGWKGGIGTASRVAQGHTVGVLVQTNFGGSLTIAGIPIYKRLQPKPARATDDGSCMIIVATDAPLDNRNLQCLAQRALAGMARTGSSFANGSGDYVIAFSTVPQLRVRMDGGATAGGQVLSNDAVSPLFQAVSEATEEAILNSLFKATDVSSRFGRAQAIPIDDVVRLVTRFEK
jgi:D-aminopeptidase